MIGNTRPKTIRLSPQLKAELERRARREDRSASSLVRLALAAYFGMQLFEEEAEGEEGAKK